MTKEKSKENPLLNILAYDFFTDEEGEGAIFLYHTGRLEILAFHKMLDAGVDPITASKLQAEFLELFSKERPGH